jgi:hypothetical protein
VQPVAGSQPYVLQGLPKSHCFLVETQQPGSVGSFTAKKHLSVSAKIAVQFLMVNVHPPFATLQGCATEQESGTFVEQFTKEELRQILFVLHKVFVQTSLVQLQVAEHPLVGTLTQAPLLGKLQTWSKQVVD